MSKCLQEIFSERLLLISGREDPFIYLAIHALTRSSRNSAILYAETIIPPLFLRVRVCVTCQGDLSQNDPNQCSGRLQNNNQSFLENAFIEIHVLQLQDIEYPNECHVTFRPPQSPSH